MGIQWTILAAWCHNFITTGQRVQNWGFHINPWKEILQGMFQEPVVDSVEQLSVSQWSVDLCSVSAEHSLRNIHCKNSPVTKVRFTFEFAGSVIRALFCPKTILRKKVPCGVKWLVWQFSYWSALSMLSIVRYEIRGKVWNHFAIT